MISDEAGQYLLNLSKESVKYFLENGKTMLRPSDYPSELNDPLGVFVTLNKNNNLRGCIGYPEPIKPAIDATIEVAVSAAFNDPRFPEISEKEFEDLDFEVTVLTKPEIIEVKKADEYFDKIEIGRDGLIIQKGYARGLLLPQVAVENAFTKEDFLNHTCMKAGISADCWMDQSCDVYKFQGQIFK